MLHNLKIHNLILSLEMVLLKFILFELYIICVIKQCQKFMINKINKSYGCVNEILLEFNLSFKSFARLEDLVVKY